MFFLATPTDLALCLLTVMSISILKSGCVRARILEKKNGHENDVDKTDIALLLVDHRNSFQSWHSFDMTNGKAAAIINVYVPNTLLKTNVQSHVIWYHSSAIDSTLILVIV